MFVLTLLACEPDQPREAYPAPAPEPSPVPSGLAEGAVVLNELVAYTGVPGDWIELYNATDEVQDLTGASLWSIDNDLQSSWDFPEGTTIGPGEYLVVDCDEAPSRPGELHASFRLAREGGEVYFAHPTPDGGALASVAYPVLDHGWGRFGDVWVREPASSRGGPNGELVQSTLTGTVYPDDSVEPGLTVACVDTPEGSTSTLAFAEFTDLPPIDTWASLVLLAPSQPLSNACFPGRLNDEVDGEISAAEDSLAPIGGISFICMSALSAQVVDDGAFQLKLFTESCVAYPPSVTVEAFVVFGAAPPGE